MKITIEMPAVQGCNVNHCAFNQASHCHAKAITIGDGLHPGCDTFIDGSPGHTAMKATAGVGACKVTHCHHNDDYECSAESIEVGLSRDGISCMTFSAR